MSTPRTPRRLPRRVYVVRRILVLIVLALVIGLIVWVVRLLWPDGEAEPEAPEPTASATQTPSPEPSPEPTAEPVASRLVQVAPATEDCDPSLLSLRPNAASQEAEGPITIYLSIATAQESACTLDLEPEDVIATIGSDGTTVWDSTPCETALLDEPVTVAPGWVTNIAVEWSGRRSGANCNGGEEFVVPGKYRLQIATRGGEPGRATLTLTEPPEPEPEDEPEDEDEDADAGDGEGRVPESEAD